jgi:hypothetical protein
MAAQRLTHVVVYADREHFANLAYLTNFDPRFEESILIVATDGKPLIVVGNECEGYLGVSPLFAAGKLRHERFQTFSLLNQPRSSSRQIREIFSAEGIGKNSRVGCIGWKYFADAEIPDGAHAIDLPAYLVDTLRALAGHEAIVNATALMMHPGFGLRANCSVSEIAHFEYTNVLASEGMKRMLFGLRPGHDRQRARESLRIQRRSAVLPHDARDRGEPEPGPVRSGRRAHSSGLAAGHESRLLGQQHLSCGLGCPARPGTSCRRRATTSRHSRVRISK